MEVDSSDSGDSGDEVPSEEGEPSGDAGTPRDVPARPPRDPLAGQVSAAEEGNGSTANAAIVAALHDFPLAPQQRAVATTLLQYALEWRTHRESRRGPAPRPPKLLVHGGPGTGKTYTMTAVDTALRRMGLPGLLCCAFTASAAILLPSGGTPHSPHVPLVQLPVCVRSRATVHRPSCIRCNDHLLPCASHHCGGRARRGVHGVTPPADADGCTVEAVADSTAVWRQVRRPARRRMSVPNPCCWCTALWPQVLQLQLGNNASIAGGQGADCGIHPHCAHHNSTAAGAVRQVHA